MLDSFIENDDDISTAESVESAEVRQLTNPYSDPMEVMRKFRSYEIDHVGNGTFQISQVNLLAKRSLEPVRSIDAQLSARGLHHRSREVFLKDSINASNIIKGMMRGEKSRAGNYKPSPQLFQPHFSRALANERLEKLDAAIADYTVCLKINPKSAVCHFNRAGLYRLKKEFVTAIEDMHQAVRLEPTNMEYRSYRALICREGGEYEQAMQDTIVVKAVSRRPDLKRLIEKSGEAAITQIILQQDTLTSAHAQQQPLARSHSIDGQSGDSMTMAGVALSEDPIVSALETPGAERSDEELILIKDFLKTVKLFAALSTQASVLTQIAAAVQLSTFEKNGVIFAEGDPGHHFFIILDGEVAITKTKVLVEASVNPDNNEKNITGNNPHHENNVSSHANGDNADKKHFKDDEAITETVVLVKLFRGHSFGETALESKGGLRTAGAMASQPTRLLSLHVDAYHSILHRFRAALKEEVRALIATNAIFASWEDFKIEHLASLVVIKQFAATAEILSANKPVPALMLVKSGIVTLLKAVPRRLLHHQNVGGDNTAHSSTDVHSSSLNSRNRRSNSANKGKKNGEPALSSSSSHLFSGETPGLWIVNKGWTTHLDEQIMREHTQFVLDQRLKSGGNALANVAAPSSNTTTNPTSSIDNGGSGSKASNNNNNLPNLDAKELDLVELAVGILGSGQVFGELAVLDPAQNSPVSAVASTAVELFCFESDVLAALGARFYGGTMRALLESIALHDPPLDKIGFFFRQKFGWEKHKHSLMLRLQGKNNFTNTTNSKGNSSVKKTKNINKSVSLPSIHNKK